MSPDQYWNGEPWLVEAYREADLLQRQRRSNDFWLQGLYFYNALSVVVGNALSKKGTPQEKYVEEPIRVIPLTEAEKEEKKRQEREKVIAYLNQFEKSFNGK